MNVCPLWTSTVGLEENIRFACTDTSRRHTSQTTHEEDTRRLMTLHAEGDLAKETSFKRSDPCHVRFERGTKQNKTKQNKRKRSKEPQHPIPSQHFLHFCRGVVSFDRYIHPLRERERERERERRTLLLLLLSFFLF